MTPAIEVDNLVKRFGHQTAVDGVSFRVQAGESFGLLGPNGAGKTTTVSVIATLLAPTSGDVRVLGHSVRKRPLEVRRLLGVVPQEIALYPTLTAWENLAFWGRMYGLSGRRLRERASAVLETMGLSDRARQPVEQFSGGMKRRLNLAIGLLHEPRVLILDEPTVGVDPQSRLKILETIQALNGQGMTVLYTSHYMEEVEFLCRRIAIMDGGRVMAVGTQKELRLLVGERDEIRVKLAGEVDPQLIQGLRGMEGVDGVELQEQSIQILTTRGRTLLAPVIAWLHGRGVPIASVSVREPDLETVFLHLTGRSLRDAGTPAPAQPQGRRTEGRRVGGLRIAGLRLGGRLADEPPAGGRHTGEPGADRGRTAPGGKEIGHEEASAR